MSKAESPSSTLKLDPNVPQNIPVTNEDDDRMVIDNMENSPDDENLDSSITIKLEDTNTIPSSAPASEPAATNNYDDHTQNNDQSKETEDHEMDQETSNKNNELPELTTSNPSKMKIEVENLVSRPRRRNTKAVNYKEKTETDIPLTRNSSSNSSKDSSSASSSSTSLKRGIKSRRGKSNSGSTSPPPSKDVSYFDVEEVVPINYQPPITSESEFNEIIDLRGAKIDSSETMLTLKNGQTIKKGDCIYMICEPPTEPFYIAQVLGFTKKDTTSTNRKAMNYNFSVCWFYRPRDLHRHAADTRLVYASLHRDNCPMTSFRGIATVKHKSEIDDLDSYKQQPDCFYFDKLYDRYMIKMYDMIPTAQLVHLPPNYFKALHKRFGYIFVEVGKADELLSSPKNCEKCLQWCSNSDSIACSGCQKSYHLLCLDPPILTKPKRGFAWYCASCNKELEDKLAENRGKMLESSQPSQIIKENENSPTPDTISDEFTDKNENSIDNQEADSSSLRYEQLAKKFLDDDKNISLKKRRDKEEWPYRYLGVHAKFEDALDLQDRPYARAASRLGSKYQCTSLCDWYDHEVQYYDPNDSSSTSNNANKRLKKYYNRNKKPSTPVHIENDILESKKFPIPDEYKDIKPKEFPGWLQPKPKGYIERGGDQTSTLLWKMPINNEEPEKNMGDMVEKYIKDCTPVAKRLKLTTVTTPNFVDAILLILMRHNYNPSECMDDVQKLTREFLREPTFTDEEIKRFEDSVRIHGSELYPVFKDVGTQASAMVVRFYYLWKKTKSGHEIWDNYPGRAKNRLKSTKNVGVDLDNTDDDGAYSSGKINRSQVKFKCMYCEANHSSEWFRAPGASTDNESHLCEGLCYRCAKLWRKYATKWENPIELIKNQEKKGAYLHKKKTEAELIYEAELVVNARENYKSHPRKISEGLKQYKTIDSDLDYINFENGKPKRKIIRKQTALPSSPVSVNNATSSDSIDSKKKIKKDKKDKKVVLPPTSDIVKKSPEKKSNKRSLKDSIEEQAKDDTTNDDGLEPEVNSDKIPRKKRAYKKRQPSEKGLKFVYGSVVNDGSNGSMKFTIKKTDMAPQGNIPASSYENDRTRELRIQLDTVRAQFEENSKSKLFNAFLDMKLRETIEALEKKISVLSSVPEHDNSGGNINLPDADVNSAVNTDGTASILSPATALTASNRLGTKDSDNDLPKRYVRRRLFLSKTSVPGSGVFETPPIQLHMDETSPTSITTTVQSNLRNKFVFQMHDQNNKGESEAYDISTDTQFQSQPNLLPSTKILPMTTHIPSNGNSSIQNNLVPTLSVKGEIEEKGEKTEKAEKKEKGSSPSFLSGAIRNNEFVTLSSSFKIKMLTPLIDYNDSITKNMLLRYTSKYDVFNPLLSDDFYVAPIYQMRPSSKELHILWKQYQTSRKSKSKPTRLFQPLYSANKRACCVCREMGEVGKMLICSNCGLNVHASCYGIRLDPHMEKDAGAYNWHCDPCSNDLHPLASTQYVCLLCNSRESNMDQAIKGDPVSIPDALKRTIEGRWCHVTCSLLCENVKYGSDMLQPIYGTHVTGIKNIFKSCSICLNNGGSIVKCEFCANKSHVTCGIDFGWKIGFQLLDVFEINDGDVVKIEGTEEYGKLKPIIYCDKHTMPGHWEISGIYSICDKGRKLGEKGNGKTLLELYYSDQRKRITGLGSGQIRRKAYDEMKYEFEQLVIKSRLQNIEPVEEVSTDTHQCHKCQRTSSLKWYSTDSGMGDICHVCFRSDQGQEEDFQIPDLNLVNTKKFDSSIYGC